MKHKIDSVSLHQIIQDLDGHISNYNTDNKEVLESLLELRNNLIKTHQPDTSLNWQILNTEVLNVLEKLQWTMIWV